MKHLRNFSKLFLLLSLIFLASCTSNPPENRTLHIISGSENRSLEPLIQEWAQANNYAVIMSYEGSLDIARHLRSGNLPYDAVWPANRLWLDYGDVNNITRYEESILRSPIVFAVKYSVADDLGWIDNPNVTMSDILGATESGNVRFMMTSATQSNSGASFYFAALSAFAGSPEVMTEETLNDPAVQEQIERILSTVDRSSGSSGFLKDLFLQEYERYDAMVNYESVIIETNQELERQGLEALYAIYPVDGLAIADSPLAYVEREIEGKEDAFLALQSYLLSDEVQQALLAQGRRTGNLGLRIENADSQIFRPEWGIDVNRVIQPIRFPNAAVIEQALNLYQTTFRRPSCTAYVLDFSGSMSNNGEAQLKAAMRTLLDQNIASDYLLQGHAEDLSMVVLFADIIINLNDYANWTVDGNDEEALRQLYLQIENTAASGGTDIFGATLVGLQELNRIREGRNCLPAVILMTDGQDQGNRFSELESYIRSTENDVPVFAITFGDAEPEQLEPLATLTFGHIFDGTGDLVTTFRQAKGYN